MLFLAGFKGHISVNDCGNGAGDTLLDKFHVCVKRNLAEDTQNDELHQFPTVLDLSRNILSDSGMFLKGLKGLTLCSSCDDSSTKVLR